MPSFIPQISLSPPCFPEPSALAFCCLFGSFVLAKLELTEILLGFEQGFVDNEKNMELLQKYQGRMRQVLNKLAEHSLREGS